MFVYLHLSLAPLSELAHKTLLITKTENDLHIFVWFGVGEKLNHFRYVAHEGKRMYLNIRFSSWKIRFNFYYFRFIVKEQVKHTFEHLSTFIGNCAFFTSEWVARRKFIQFR